MSTHNSQKSMQPYTIKEVSDLSGLPESTLRYYESVRLIEGIERDKSSDHRIYTEENLNLILAISCLSTIGMSLKDMRTYLGNRAHPLESAEQQIQLFEQQKKRLVEEEKQIKIRKKYIDLKIAYWEAIKEGNTEILDGIGQEIKIVAQDLKISRKNL